MTGGLIKLLLKNLKIYNKLEFHYYTHKKVLGLCYVKFPDILFV